MLGPWSKGNHARHDLPGCRNMLNHEERESGGTGPPAREQRHKDSAVHNPLDCLDNDSGHPSPALHGFEVLQADVATQQAGGEPCCGRNRVLYREVDSHSPGGRHRMGRIADAEHAVHIPAPQPIEAHVKPVDVIQ
jgi:hypothetical protein